MTENTADNTSENEHSTLLSATALGWAWQAVTSTFDLIRDAAVGIGERLRVTNVMSGDSL
jgi:hypothetical protein